MGYNTYFTGEIVIDPPISWGDVAGSEFLPDNAWHNDRDVSLRIEEETVNTDDGILIRRRAVAIEPAYDDSYKGYDIVDHVQLIVDRYGEGRTFTGRIDASGEESGDLWRLEVHDGRAVRVEPRIVWPDGSEEPKRR